MCNSLIDINTLVITDENMISFVRSFNGVDTYSVQKWITDIEDAATSLTLQEEQKVKLAMKSATGLAKSWLESEGKFQIIRNEKELQVEPNITWDNFKTISKEMSNKIKISRLHKWLASRTMKESETVFEYYTDIKRTAQDEIKSEIIIQYVINGIPDDTDNKAILYGATNLENFTEKLKLYETIRKK